VKEEEDQLKTGQYIGNYRVMRHLAEGGMGVVFEALHEEIGRRVAIKVLRRDISTNPDLARRFINEARVVTQIQHSGLVQVFDYGRLPDGSAYIVMEFLQGRPLTDRIRNAGGGLACSDVLRFGRQLAVALTVTHEMGIVHRDMKPDNVMLIADREVIGGERTKILDFGIAKISNPSGGKTRTHAILGSAPYMAPEQCRGSGEITDRTDVYALGVMLFEMVTGRLPFVAEEEVEVMAMHIKEPAPPVDSLKREIPSELADLIGRMLRKIPAERPSMRQVTETIEAMMPQPGSGVIPVFQVAEMNRKRRIQLYGLGGGLVLLAAGLTAAVLVNRPVAVPKPVPVPAAEVPLAQPQPSNLARQISWSIETIPPGAEVIQDSTGKSLGKTPWKLELLPSSGTLMVTLRLDGYFKKPLSLDLSRNENLRESLQVIDDSALELPTIPTKPTKHSGGRSR